MKQKIQLISQLQNITSLQNTSAIPSKTKAFFWKYRYAVLTILLLAINFSQKLYHIKQYSIWGDEVYTLWFGLHSLEEMLPNLQNGNDAPVYFLLMHFYIKLFGIDIFPVKLLSILFNTATLGVIILMARKFVNLRFAWYSAILFISSSLLLHYAMEVRPYALMVLLSACSLYFYLDIFSGKKNIWTIIAFGLVNALLFYTHYVSAVFLLVQVIMLPFLYRFREGNYSQFALVYSITALFVSPYFYMLLNKLGSMQGSWQQVPDYGTLMYSLTTFAETPQLLDIYLVFLVACAVFIYLYRKNFARSYPIHAFYLFTACFILPVIIIYFISLYSPIFVTRYFLFSCLALYLALAFAYEIIPLPGWLKLAASAYFAYYLFNLTNIGPYKNEDWRLALPIIKQNHVQHSVIFVQPEYFNETFAYHYNKNIFRNYDSIKPLLRKENIFCINNGNNIAKYLETNSPQRITLVQTQWVITDPQNTAQRLLDSAYQRTAFHEHIGIRISIYQKK